MLSAWILSLNWTQINRASKKYEINPKLVGAIIMQESAGNECATRYEDHYRWLYKPEHYADKNGVTLETETVHQKTSWGLMQVMGAVARELGFQGDLVKLCDPATNMKYGIKQLMKLKHRHKSNINDVIASYNAGSPRKDKYGQYLNNYYVIRVNAFMSEL